MYSAVVPSADFDRSVMKFISDNEYKGGQVGVMIEDRLAFAKGYGKNHEHQDIYVHNLIPVGSLSKAFTAVTILKLVEDGSLDLNAKVFGKVVYLVHSNLGTKQLSINGYMTSPSTIYYVTREVGTTPNPN